MRRVLPLGGVAAMIVASGCSAAEGEPAAPPESVATVESPIASVMGGVEAAIDAPWRLEPIGADIDARSNIYPPIPIIVSVHDASLQKDPDTRVPLGDFCDVTILEQWNDGQTHYGPYDPTVEWKLVTTIPWNSPLVREIERSDKWPYSSDHAANHRVCRHWAGEDCASNRDVGSSAEWHATIAYAPQQYAVGGTIAKAFRPLVNGDDVRITAMARFAAPGQACGPAPTWPSPSSFDRISKYGRTITNSLSIHLGEDRLPRFDDGWVYGDLHYHSQGTDNEGESAYAYRPTLQAMRAMGLDFLFATDHASDSGQVTDIDEIYIDKRFDIPYAPGFIDDMAYEYASKIALGVTSSTTAARDMNPTRWRAMRDWLNRASSGANAEVMRAFQGGRFAPRIFLGGEVDVIPEMSNAERASGRIDYGNGRRYWWAGACNDVPSVIKTVDEWTTKNVCDSVYDLTEVASEGNRWLLRDIQGLGEQYFARQHMVFLPTDGSRDDGFVSSRTQLYGGANERLRDLVTPGYWNSIVGKGYGFLAHPVDAASGAGMGRLGPDIVPYSDAQLRTAFSSPAILGLQLWNEDTRLESTPEAPGFPLSTTASSNVREWGKWLGTAPKNPYRDLHDGLFAWDKMLQWGLRPSQTASLGWLPAGEPRRVFMAGGSDAHGDWNYRREGRIDGLSGVVDTAMGKPRNLVNVGLTRPESAIASDGSSVGQVGQGQVTAALARGEFSVTDGPAVRIAIDMNGNGVIDDGDTPMGGVGAVTNGIIPVIVEWKSTYEFQTVSSIDVYVGVTNDAIDASLVYAPVNHGIHTPETPSGALDPNVYVDPKGVGHRVLKDHYMADPSGLLHIVPTSADHVVGGSPLWGRRKILVDMNAFTVGKLRIDTTQGEPVCRPNFYCRKPGFADKCEYICTTPAPVSTYHFDSPSPPSRAYVRAFARTMMLPASYCADPTTADARRGKCIERLAFTNPVWATRRTRLGTGVIVSPLPVLASP